MTSNRAEEARQVSTEYALVDESGRVRSGPHPLDRWNDTITLDEAAERWYPGCTVMSRTVTTFDPVVSEWVPRFRPDKDDS